MNATLRQNLNAAISRHLSDLFGNRVRYTLTRPGLAVIESDQSRYVDEAITFLATHNLATRVTSTEYDPETEEYYATISFAQGGE